MQYVLFPFSGWGPFDKDQALYQISPLESMSRFLPYFKNVEGTDNRNNLFGDNILQYGVYFLGIYLRASFYCLGISSPKQQVSLIWWLFTAAIIFCLFLNTYGIEIGLSEEILEWTIIAKCQIGFLAINSSV